MASGHVLRFPRSDSEGGFVVIQATPTRSKALDVKLVGTDGVEPYAVSLRQDKVAALRVKNSPCTEEEWVSILTAVLQQEPANDIEVLADVQNEAVLTLTVRKRGKEFTQRLGAIELSHSPRELIELFDWCALSAQTANEAKEALASATEKASQLEESVRELKAQLDELVAAKEADESELLEKFRDLLNEKKVKIRQQQKLLASASVEPDRLAQVQSSQAAGKGHAAAKSRPAKRKTAPAPVNSDSSSDEGFEKMDVDLAMEPAHEDSEQQRDTTEDEDETASEDDDDEPAAPAPEKQQKSAGSSQPRGKATAAKKEAPPAKRELPFARKKEAPKAPLPPADSETESDDEL
ncbi:mitotic apparatus protein p62-like protein [Colletotrichum incanum]|uniref:Mitotic apparatus protein p62-like protein n=1 Tax=Colletotrichum incanum TaxID=1573173 RepID=A0A167C550_COLIC|nr:mitotic apparatus protein p62-like protein [Colletotrichum incanum]OHW99825.1 mitotic apparatus protein p62-like protein [Colletotrichum incanum]